jgi:hypothetical protein
MNLARRARRSVPALVTALALGVAACGDDDAERALDKGAKEAEKAGKKAEKAGKDAANKVENSAEDAKDEAEK